MTTDPTAWLKARRNCTLGSAFRDLKDYAQCYIEAANAMQDCREKGHPFEIEEGNGLRKRFIVRGFPFGATDRSDKVEIVLELHDKKITITPDMSVTLRWNPRREICELWCRDEAWTAEQISQLALDPLFFAQDQT